MRISNLICLTKKRKSQKREKNRKEKKEEKEGTTTQSKSWFPFHSVWFFNFVVQKKKRKEKGQQMKR